MTDRKIGPDVSGIFPSWSGFAGTIPVHWIGDTKRADELEIQYEKGSELQKLLLRNAYTAESLTDEEKKQGFRLIAQAPEGTEKCEHLTGVGKNPTFCEKLVILDTGMCKGHCRYALAMGL